MNFEKNFDACRNIYGKSSSTFWGIFTKIPKLISRVATLLDTTVFCRGVKIKKYKLP